MKILPVRNRLTLGSACSWPSLCGCWGPAEVVGVRGWSRSRFSSCKGQRPSQAEDHAGMWVGAWQVPWAQREQLGPLLQLFPVKRKMWWKCIPKPASAVLAGRETG